MMDIYEAAELGLVELLSIEQLQEQDNEVDQPYANVWDDPDQAYRELSRQGVIVNDWQE